MENLKKGFYIAATKNKKLFYMSLALFTVLLITIFATIIILFFKSPNRQISREKSVSLQAEKTVPTKTPTPYIERLKKYSNPTLGFEFQYHAEDILTEKDSGQIIIGHKQNDGEMYNYLTVTTNPSMFLNKSSYPTCNGNDTTMSTNFPCLYVSEEYAADTTEIIDGKNASKFYILLGGGGYIVFQISEPQIEIKYLQAGGGGRLNPFLSTFKFTEPQTVDTSNWKTYTNSKFGFEFKYPQDWKVTDNSYNQTNSKLAAVNVTSPTKYGLKGYEEVGYRYIIHIDFTTGTPRLGMSGQEFIKGYEEGDQAVEPANIPEGFLETSTEPKIASEILRNARIIK